MPAPNLRRPLVRPRLTADVCHESAISQPPDVACSKGARRGDGGRESWHLVQIFSRDIARCFLAWAPLATHYLGHLIPFRHQKTCMLRLMSPALLSRGGPGPPSRMALQGAPVAAIGAWDGYGGHQREESHLAGQVRTEGDALRYHTPSHGSSRACHGTGTPYLCDDRVVTPSPMSLQARTMPSQSPAPSAADEILAIFAHAHPGEPLPVPVLHSVVPAPPIRQAPHHCARCINQNICAAMSTCDPYFPAGSGTRPSSCPAR